MSPAALAVLMGLALAPPSASFAVPPRSGRVVDVAGVLDAQQEARLTQRLAAHEAATGHQIAVAVVATLGGATVEEASLRTAEQWQLGAAGRDDGVLFFLAPTERAVRIEVGYGLEGLVPDVVADRILRERVLPRLQAGDVAGGVDAGVDALIARTGGAAADGAAPIVDDPVRNLGMVFLLLLFVRAMLARFRRGTRAVLLGAAGAGVAFFFGSGLVVVAGAVMGLLLGIVPGSGMPWLMAFGHARGGSPFRGGGGRFGGGGASRRW